MKIATIMPLFRVILIGAYLFTNLLIVSSCNSPSLHREDLDLRIHAKKSGVGFMSDGNWSSVMGTCIPPSTNCGIGARLPESLKDAVERNDLDNYFDTDEGKIFLLNIDPLAANDLSSRQVTIKTFSNTPNHYFFVYPDALGPYEGPDYSRNGEMITNE